jgi:DNA-binding transcriptional ArsR family regulator
VDYDELAAACHALSDPVRAHILQFLLGCCCAVGVTESGEVARMEGATAGQICCHVTGDEKINTRISFHLKELRKAGLILVEQRGKFHVCTPNRELLARLAAFFSEASVGGNCC